MSDEKDYEAAIRELGEATQEIEYKARQTRSKHLQDQADRLARIWADLLTRVESTEK